MRKYSEEVKKFIVDNVQGTTVEDLAVMVNAKFGTEFTESKMRDFKRNHGLKSGRRGVPVERPSELYPKEIKDFIEAHYKGTGPKDMAELLNRTFNTKYKHSQIKCYYANHKLNSGLSGRFQKGYIPHNKGKKGIRLSPATEFKKGHRPHNWRPVGTERVVDGYVQTKVEEPNKWESKHKLLWENAHGPIPKNHVVIFGDRDRRNFDLDNLILVSRAQLSQLNKNALIQDNADLTRTGVIIADLITEISSRKKAKKR